MQRLAGSTSRACPHNRFNVRVSARVRIATVQDISLNKTPLTRGARIDFSNNWEGIPRNTNESTCCHIEEEWLALQNERVESMLVLQDINTSTSNTSAKGKRPNLCTLRRLLATDGRVDLHTGTNKTPNVCQKTFVRCPKFRIFSDGASRSNADQASSTLLHAAPSNSKIQPNPHRQCIQITTVRLFNKEVPAGIQLHCRGDSRRGTNTLRSHSAPPIGFRVQDFVQFLKTLHSCAWGSHYQHIWFTTVDILEEMRLTLRRIEIKANNNIKVCSSNITTSNQKLCGKSTTAAKLCNINVAR